MCAGLQKFIGSMCMQVPKKSERDIRSPVASYRILYATWVLVTELKFSVRRVSILHC